MNGSAMISKTQSKNLSLPSVPPHPKRVNGGNAKSKGASGTREKDREEEKKSRGREA